MQASKRRFFKISFLFLLLLALMAAWLGFGERGLGHLYRMEQERQSHLERIGRLERDNRELLDEIERLRNDPEYIEAMGRRELGLVKDEEILYRFEKNPRPKQKPMR